MYVLLGSHGNITAQAARLLLNEGHPVRVVGRNAAALAPLQALGAELAVGDARDAAFVARAFRGASAIYTMIPSDYAAPDLRRDQTVLGTAAAQAIEASGVARVVNLSSFGAEHAAGTGPIAGLHEQEQRLGHIHGLDLLHLRPAYFMENHLHMAGAIVALGVYPSLERSDVPVPMVATADIAAVVARELVHAPSSGVLHLMARRRYTFQQAATILGGAIGRPALRHLQLEPEAGVQAMVDAGFSRGAAKCMAEMAQWLSGQSPDAPPQGPVAFTPTTLEDFAPRMRAAVEALPRH